MNPGENSVTERHSLFIEEPVDDAPAPEPSLRERINPWLVGLWLASIVLVTTGFWARLQFAKYQIHPYVVPPSVEDAYVMPAVLEAFSPWLVALGLAAGIGATYLHAARWMKAHEQ
jgi:hypothetical protein